MSRTINNKGMVISTIITILLAVGGWFAHLFFANGLLVVYAPLGEMWANIISGFFIFGIFFFIAIIMWRLVIIFNMQDKDK